MYKVLLAFLFISFLSCKGSKSVTTGQSLDEEITKHLGAEYERVDQGSLALCYTSPEYIGSERKTAIVIDTLTLEILYGPEKLNAIIQWSDEAVLSITQIVGVLKDKKSSDAEIRYVDLNR